MNWYIKATSQNEEWIEQQVATFIEGKIDQALNLLKRDLQTENKLRFREYLRQVWPEGRGTDFMLPDSFPKEISAYPVKIQMGGNEAYFLNGKYAGLKINPYEFDQVQTPDQIDSIRQGLFQSISHETEHIFNEGSSPDEEGPAGTIQYLLNPGEIAAHARQLAYLYIQMFPSDQTVNMSKMPSVIAKTNHPVNYNTYIISFADPAKQQKYREYGDIGKGNRDFVAAFNGYFKRYKESS